MQYSESGLDDMVGLGLTYHCHISLIFYFIEIMIIIMTIIITSACAMQRPMALCCGFEVFKLKL